MNKFKYRIVGKDSYYSNMVTMWADWNFPVLPKECLPEKIFVVSKDGIDLYAIPVYSTDSDFVILGFPVGNKRAPKEDKEGAFGFLLGKVSERMKGLGKTRLLTMSMNPKLMKEFEQSGFQISDEGTNFYIKNI